MKVGSLFSGIGGFDLGFERAGFEIAWCVEKDKHAQKVLRSRFPRATIHDDICTVDPKYLCEVDVICGGFPCQDLSVAGKRVGLAGARSGLFHEAMRIVRTIRPRLLFLENVPGLLSSNNGLDFATVLREVGEGWPCEEVGWRVLDSQFFGVAQRRRRVFVVAGSRSGCAEEVLSLSESSGGDPPSRRKEREAVADLSARCFDVDCISSSEIDASLPQTVGALCADDWRGAGNQYVSQNKLIITATQDGRPIAKQKNGFETEDTQPTHAVAYGLDEEQNGAMELMGTLKARKEGGGFEAAVATPSVVRRLTPVECERLQGFPDGWTDIGTPEKPTADTHRYKQLGNAVTVNVAEWLARRAFRTLTCDHAT